MKKKILMLAQTPPPYHGQAVILDALVGAKWDWCEKKHIRLNYSESIEDVGRFSIPKIGKMIKIIYLVYIEKKKGAIDTIIYPPAPARRVPFFRDIITLFFIRKWTRNTAFHFHSGGFHKIASDFSPLEKIIARKIYGKAEAVILSPDFQKEEIGWLKLSDIYINASGIEDKYKNINKIKNKIPIILSIGLLSREKGIMVSLTAASILKGRGANFKWIFVGGWQTKRFENEAKNFVLKNNLSNHIEFKKPKVGNQKWDIYRKADIICFPTYYSIEVMPIVIIEAMMMKKAIVSTRWRSIGEMINNNKEGILVEIQNPLATANALEILLEDNFLRTKVAQEARRKYLKYYTLAAHVNRMEDIYKNITGEI